MPIPPVGTGGSAAGATPALPAHNEDITVVTLRGLELRPPRERRKGERDRHGAEAEREGADVEPGVAAEAIVDPAAAERAERHAEARHHGGRSQHRAHDLLR